MGTHVRPAREGDLDDLAEIHACSYPEPGGLARHTWHVTHNEFGGLECVRVAEKDGKVVGFAALYDLEIWLGGRRVPTGGIGSLAVAPEARREGVARHLLEQLHAEIGARKSALALLYPFEQRFYARHGYAHVAPLLSLELASAAAAAFGGADGGARFSSVRLEGARLREARDLYAEIGEKTSGRLVRSESEWLRRFAHEERHWMGVASPDGQLEAYASFSYRGPSLSRTQTLVVHELTARGPIPTRAMLAALGRQRDQIADIVLTVPYGDPLSFAFEDPAGARRGADLSHPIGTLSAGPMVRIVDIRRVLAARGYEGDADLTFACNDGASSESVRLVVRGGRAEVLDAGGPPNVEIARATLGSVVAAGLSPADAAALGLLRADAATLAVMERLFSGPRFQCLDPF